MAKKRVITFREWEQPMLSVLECRERAGLRSHEVVLGVSPSARHETLLSSYLLNLKKGERFVLEMIVADLRAFLDLGAPDYAGDVFVVLRMYLEARPHLSLRSRLRREFATSDVDAELFGSCGIRPTAYAVPAYESNGCSARRAN